MKHKSKELLSILLTLCMVLAIVPTTAGASVGDYSTGDLEVIETIIDDNGLAWAKATEAIGTVDETWMETNWLGVTWNVATPKRIIELDLNDLGLTGEKLDVSDLTELVQLDCSNNFLDTVDVTGCTKLKTLYCYYSQLEALDVSKNTQLSTLWCFYDELKELDVSANTALEALYCNHNMLYTVDVANNTALVELSCGANNLSDLDVSRNTALEYLDCSYNVLFSLDVSKNTALIELGCHVNPLGELDVSSNTELKRLWCFNNWLNSLDVSTNTALEMFRCSGNSLTSLDVTNNIVLKDLNCSANLITALDLSQNTALEILDCERNALDALDVSLNTSLEKLNCRSNKLTGLDVTGLNALRFLDVRLNSLADESAIIGAAALPAFPATGWDHDDFYYTPQNTEQGITIDLAIVPGVTAPVRGATPKTAITITPQYTGSITWSPAGSTFAATTVYTATITIKPQEGYTLNGVGANFFTVAGATSVTNAANSGVITAVFPETEAASSGNTGGGGGGGSTQSNPSGSFSGGSDYTLGSETEIVYVVQKDFAQFQNVQVGGVTITRDKEYTAVESSTRITLLPAYLDSLKVGNYAMTVNFRDGTYASATFTVVERKEQAIPETQNPGAENPDEQNQVTDTGTLFEDVNTGDWFYSGVLYAYNHGLMTGTSASPMLFSPNDAMTRGMVVTVLYRLQNAVPSIYYENPFDDVDESQWYAEAVKWAYHNGIVAGYGHDQFGPNDNITREQMAAILYNYCVWKGIDVSVGEDTNILSYEDAFEISEYAIPAFQWACGAGVINGKPGELLDPKGNAARAEFATVLMRFPGIEG